MLIVLDSNEYIFSFGIFKKQSSAFLLDKILDTFPENNIRVPRIIVEEVRRHLSQEEFKEFILFITSITYIDEDIVVPFEIAAKYENFLKPADALIAGYVEYVGADLFVSENRHFLIRHNSKLPFKVLKAEDALKIL